MFGRRKKQQNRWTASSSAASPAPLPGARPNRAERDWVSLRLVAVAVIFGALWAVLWFRAWDLQMVQGEWLAEKVSRQHKGSELITGHRGSILDRNGNVLARSVEVRSIFVRPYEVANIEESSATLAKILEMPAKKVQVALRSEKSFVWLKRKVDDKTAAEIRSAQIKGVDSVIEFERVYPYKQLAGQLLGFVNVDEKGIEGLEKSFDNELAGTSSRVAVQRDAVGRSLYLDGIEDRAELRGRDLELTIDMQLQYFTEEALAKAVTQYEGKWGGCLVIDVATGEILAWAEYPFFNPNAHRDYKDPRAWRARLAADALEQGSTIKPLLIASALSEKRVKPDSRYYCEQGNWKTKRFNIRDTHAYGWLTLNEIIRYSSNIGAAKIGMEMGAPLYHQYLVNLGFGQRTGLPMVGESIGILRQPKQWAEVDLAAASFGQSFSATALQMGEAYLTIASGGIKRPLKLVKGYHEEEMQERRIFSKEACASVLEMLHDVVEEDGTGQRARIPGIAVGGKTGTAQKANAGSYGSGRVSSFIGIAPLSNPRYLVITMVDEPQKSSYGGVVAAPVFRHVVSRALAYNGELPDPESNVDEGRPFQALQPEQKEQPGQKEQSGQSEIKAPSLVAQAKAEPVKNQLPASPDQMESAAQPEKVVFRNVSQAAGENAEHNSGAASALVPDVVGQSVREAMEIFMRLGLEPVVMGQGHIVSAQKPAAGARIDSKGNVECVLWLSEQGI